MKIALLKISGKSLDFFLTKESLKKTVDKIKQAYDGLIIVHGAGESISEWSEALGHEVKFKDGQRVTTKEVVDVVAAVQSGVVNSKIVSGLNSIGINAIGLTGIDRGSFIAEIVNKDLGYVGIPKQVSSTEWLFELLDKNVVPVFSSLCRDNVGNLINVNADFFAGLIATSVNAESVFFLSDVNGVIMKGDFVDKISELEILDGINKGEITGGMIPKLKSCVELLDKGINKIWIGSRNLENLFDDESKHKSVGTWITQSSYAA